MVADYDWIPYPPSWSPEKCLEAVKRDLPNEQAAHKRESMKRYMKRMEVLVEENKAFREPL